MPDRSMSFPQFPAHESDARRKMKNPWRTLARAAGLFEPLEGRVLLSASVTGQLTQISKTGPDNNPVYTYDVELHDTGTTPIGTFWMSWVPGLNFLPSTPISENSPTGWGPPAIVGTGDSSDGASIQWVAQSGSELAAGGALDGFQFSTHDSPTALAADSVQHPGYAALTSFIYGGMPFSDAGVQFTVSVAQASTPVATSTAVVASSPTITSGDSASFTATVTPASGSEEPTGTVTFSANGAAIGTVAVSTNGTAVLATTTLPVGADSITAVYNGDSNFSASTSSAITQTVNPLVAGVSASTTALGTSAAIINTGASVTFTATVEPATAGGPLPTGTVTFLDGTTSLGSVALGGDDTSAFSTTTLSAGVHTITASYSGDGTYQPSISSVVSETVNTVVLAPSIGKTTLPADAVSGQPAKGVITVSVANQTASLVKGKNTIAIYASSDGIIDGSSTLVTQVTRTLAVKAGKASLVAVHIKSLPAGLSAGTYTLLTRDTDPSSNVVDSSTGPALNVAAPVVALSESFSRLTLPATVVAPGKAHAVAAMQISNSGNIISSGPTTVAIYASASGTIDANAIQIKSLSHNLRIRPGKSITASLKLTTLPNIPAGTYFIVAQVIDPQQQTSTVISSTTITVSN